VELLIQKVSSALGSLSFSQFPLPRETVRLQWVPPSVYANLFLVTDFSAPCTRELVFFLHGSTPFSPPRLLNLFLREVSRGLNLIHPKGFVSVFFGTAPFPTCVSAL